MATITLKREPATVDLIPHASITKNNVVEVYVYVNGSEFVFEFDVPLSGTLTSGQLTTDRLGGIFKETLVAKFGKAELK